MDTIFLIIHILSFPFWFLGLTLGASAIFDSVKVNEGFASRKATAKERIIVFGIGSIFIIIAYLMATV